MRTTKEYQTNFRNARCYVCNRVSHSEIADEMGEQYTRRFFNVDDGFACSECQGWHDDIMTEWEMGDEAEDDEDE